MPAEIDARLRALAESTARLERTLATFTDDDARGPSLLPGWSRGHVVTHLARNADALINLTVWVKTGVRTPMYPSPQARDDAIEAQSGRTAAALVADLREASRRLTVALESMSDADWQGSWGDADRREPAARIIDKRLVEVELHNVDLGLGYTLAHLPEDFVEWLIGDTAARLTRRGETPGFTLVANDGEGSWPVAGGGELITGPPPALLGWLVGRTDGIGIHSDQQLPQLGDWL